MATRPLTRLLTDLLLGWRMVNIVEGIELSEMNEKMGFGLCKWPNPVLNTISMRSGPHGVRLSVPDSQVSLLISRSLSKNEANHSTACFLASMNAMHMELLPYILYPLAQLAKYCPHMEVWSHFKSSSWLYPDWQ